MKPIAIVNPDFDNYLSIRYEFTNVCNYNCNYCWPDSHAGTTKWPDFDLICKNFDHLIKVYKTHLNKKIVSVELVGGEPTIWPRLGEFAKFLKERHDVRVSVDTNGSRTLRWWKEYSQYFNDIAISAHHEFCDVEHLKKLLDLIYQNGVTMGGVSVCMDPSAWDKCIQLVDTLVAHPVPWLVKTTTLKKAVGSDIGSIKDYSLEQLAYLQNKIKKLPPNEYLEKMRALKNIQEEKTQAVITWADGSQEPYTTFAIMSKRVNTFFGWECNLGVDRVNIQRDGALSGTCGETKIYGDDYFNIYDLDFVEKFTHAVVKPIRCSMLICSCKTEIRINKRKLNV
jgi:organic radical activating enzyme